MATRIYSYSCRIDKSPQRPLVEKQLHQAVEYYNRMVELERKRMEEFGLLQQKFSPDVQAKSAELDQLNALMADAVAKLHTTKIKLRSKRGGEEERKAVAEIRAQIKIVKEELKVAKTYLRDSAEFITAVDDSAEKHDVACKALYAEFTELFWGTKNQIREDVQTAVKTTKYGPPRFKSFRNRDGRLTCQVMGGLSTTEVFSSRDTRIQLHRMEAPLRDEKHKYRPNTTPGALHRKWHRVLFRIGSAEKAKPLWLECRIVMHRPLPINGKIVSVSLVRRQGYYVPTKDPERERKVYRPYDEYFMQFTVVTPDEVPNFGPDNAVAIDLGWRMMPNRSIRVAYFRSTGGVSGTLELPENVWQRARKCEELQSIMDMKFNEMRQALLEWLTLHPHPEWLKEKCETLPHWKSRFKLLGLVAQWQQFDGDEAIYEALSTWRDKDQHLNTWRSCNYSKMERTRLLIYRNFAAKLYKAYGTVVVEDFDIAEMRKKPNTEETTETFDHNMYRNVAAIGLLRGWLITKFGKFRHVKAPTAGSTQFCHSCGSEEFWNRQKLTHTCSKCDETWDQDDNAARNLLSYYRTVKAEFEQKRSEAVATMLGTPKETRWSKRKAKKKPTPATDA